ncbi:hypothetical protein OKW22_000710 [Bacilli bacterium PM5-3]|nr:hypothetical protein [Bacilli bacterium PM5-3]MDH6603794.1 hypothetical protein [Bacilli bacterium PM5-9]
MNYLNLQKGLRTQREMYKTKIDDQVLFDAIECARYAASARNEQVVRYAFINDEKTMEMFNLTNLPTSHKIANEQAPSAYIIIGSNEDRKNSTIFGIDIGIVSQIIREYLNIEGYSSLGIYSFDRIKTKELIGVNDFYPEFTIAIGKSDQVVRVEDSDSEVSNYRNKNNEHTVRKLKTSQLIVNR